MKWIPSNAHYVLIHFGRILSAYNQETGLQMERKNEEDCKHNNLITNT